MRLKEVEVKQSAYNQSEREMLNYVLTFSELVKEASTLYKLANDSEKRRITSLIFSELTISDGRLEKYNAKQPFDILLKQVDYCGGPGWT
tara:strand:- start:7 stop:276 length:270 start_codon:yes stop_codon:yes gene_type:complete